MLQRMARNVEKKPFLKRLYPIVAPQGHRVPLFGRMEGAYCHAYRGNRVTSTTYARLDYVCEVGYGF